MLIKNKILILIILAFFLVGCTNQNINYAPKVMEEKSKNTLKCEDYHYSNCPDGCLKSCISSGTYCEPNPQGGPPNCMETSDCDGNGSCKSQ